MAGKIFLISAAHHDEHLVTLKSDPEESPVLQKAYPSIRPGYHMNKRHWVSVAPGPDISEQLVRELVVDAYRRVVESLPRARQPAEYRLDWAAQEQAPE